MVRMFQEKMADDGVLMSEGELDGLLGDIEGACTYDNMVRMFREKMAGDGNDSDALIVQAFKAFDQEGKIDSKMFQHALMTYAVHYLQQLATIQGAAAAASRNRLNMISMF